MSAARIPKLEALLRRVQERSQQPRLQAVAAREFSATMPDLERAVPPEHGSLAELEEPPTMPPAAIEPPPKAPSISPLETAMSQLNDSGPLELPLPAPAVSLLEQKPAASVPQDMLITHRPQAEPFEPVPPVELTRPKKPLVEREPTIEFETAKVRVNAREARSVGEPPAPASPAALPPAPLSAPSQTLEAAPLPQAAQPARSVSEARVEAPKTFGDLLDQSLALRPRG